MKKVTVLLAVLVLLSANFTNAQENLPNVRTEISLIPDKITFEIGGVTLYQLQSKDGNLFVTMNETVYDFYRIATSLGLTARADGVFLKSELAQLLIPGQYQKLFNKERSRELAKIAKLRDPGVREKTLEKSIEDRARALEDAADKKDMKSKEKMIEQAEDMLERAEERREAKLAKAIRQHEDNESERMMKAMEFMEQLDNVEELNTHYLLSGYGLRDKTKLPIVLGALKKHLDSKKAEEEATSQSEQIILVPDEVLIEQFALPEASSASGKSKDKSSQSNKDKKDSSKKSALADWVK